MFEFGQLDGVEIFHNNFVQLVSNPFSTNAGVGDPEAGVGSRIGDKITPKGYSYKMMIELNERFSDVTFRFLFIKSAKEHLHAIFLTAKHMDKKKIQQNMWSRFLKPICDAGTIGGVAVRVQVAPGSK